MWERCLDLAQDKDKCERSMDMRQKFEILWSYGVSPFGNQEIEKSLETEL
jgi:hypothetical protein